MYERFAVVTKEKMTWFVQVGPAYRAAKECDGSVVNYNHTMGKWVHTYPNGTAGAGLPQIVH
jgi:hypothetical protein